MTKHGRVVISLTKERVDLLAMGKDILLTQGGVHYLVRAETGCCDGMRVLLSNVRGRRIAMGMKYCPYCQKELHHTDGKVYQNKSNSLKGCKRVKDTVTGRYKFVKPEVLRGHTV